MVQESSAGRDAEASGFPDTGFDPLFAFLDRRLSEAFDSLLSAEEDFNFFAAAAAVVPDIFRYQRILHVKLQLESKKELNNQPERFRLMGLTPFVDLYPKRKEKQDFSGLYSKLLGLPLEGAIAFYPKTQIICYIAALKVLKYIGSGCIGFN